MKHLEINPKNLRRLCGLNGFTVRELAESLDVSETLLYRAAANPREYPNRFAQLEHKLPIRTMSPEAAVIAA